MGKDRATRRPLGVEDRESDVTAGKEILHPWRRLRVSQQSNRLAKVSLMLEVSRIDSGTCCSSDDLWKSLRVWLDAKSSSLVSTAFV